MLSRGVLEERIYGYRVVRGVFKSKLLDLKYQIFYFRHVIDLW